MQHFNVMMFCVCNYVLSSFFYFPLFIYVRANFNEANSLCLQVFLASKVTLTQIAALVFTSHNLAAS